MTLRLYTTGIAALLLAATGCDLVYSLDRPDAPPADGPLADEQRPYDRCGPFLYDEPLRYAFLTNPHVQDESAALWSWSEARTACRQRGMDLAVFNDAHELGAVTGDASWPYWMGASRSSSTWTTVDECPAMMPTGANADSCGIVAGPNTITATSCTGALADPDPEQPPVVVGALCETPRPDAGPCTGNDPATTEYAMSPSAMTFAQARAFCADRGGRPVVFETNAEWLEVSKRVNDELRTRFWVGSTFDGTTWKTESQCPGHYPWASGGPSATPLAEDCMGSVMIDVPDGDGGELHSWTVGVDRLACSTAQMHALCEI